jgi:glycosyltransferase involved in cell wall biosynthesis
MLSVQGADFSLEVATVDEGAAAAEAVRRLRESGAVVHSFGASPVASAIRLGISGSLVLWLFRNAGRFEVIHLHGALRASSLAGLIAGRLRGVPVILTPHESLTEHDIRKSRPLKRIAKRLVRRLYLRHLTAIVFAAQMELIDSLSGTGTRAVVIAHPVELPSVVARRRAPGPLRIGFLGRFDPKKNLELLLHSLPSHAELVVAGSGRTEVVARMHAIADRAGAGERVRWLGFIGEDQKAEFFDQIDILAMPSRYECFGMAAAEALAFGVPVVVASATGIAPIVRRYDCGYVVEPEEESLRTVLSQEAHLTAKAARAREAAAIELAPERHAQALADLYHEILRQQSR